MSLNTISSPLWKITTEITLKLPKTNEVKPTSFYIAIPKNIARRQEVQSLCCNFPAQEVDDENGNNFLRVEVPHKKYSFVFCYQAFLKIFANSYDPKIFSHISKHKDDRYIQQETGIEINHPKIQALSQKIKGTSPTTVLEQAIHLVHKTITYKTQPQEYGALYSVLKGKGDCTEYACLLTALLRTKNIASRIVLGYLGGRELHAITEVYLNEIWIPVDITHAKNLFLGTGKEFLTLMQGNWLQKAGKEQLATFYYRTSRNSRISISNNTNVEKVFAKDIKNTLSIAIPMKKSKRNIKLYHDAKYQCITIENFENLDFQGVLMLTSISCIWFTISINIKQNEKKTLGYPISHDLTCYKNVLQWCLVNKLEEEVAKIKFAI